MSRFKAPSGPDDLHLSVFRRPLGDQDADHLNQPRMAGRGRGRPVTEVAVDVCTEVEIELREIGDKLRSDTALDAPPSLRGCDGI